MSGYQQILYMYMNFKCAEGVNTSELMVLDYDGNEGRGGLEEGGYGKEEDAWNRNSLKCGRTILLMCQILQPLNEWSRGALVPESPSLIRTKATGSIPWVSVSTCH